ncbi:DUF4198 domain-containing protein [Rhodopirellula sallentina]|uniref:Putative secreted protein n=1 Tax=Rhodopirellula sallentina SM41 TaxID=1263870 RepID=M5U9Z6_9BACT|nr:DUF4198 domain-containing protein [Rhodopirellula sallentina]EMI58242.1 putative secreted protein [Rhodopirellula sallentina SM41]
MHRFLIATLLACVVAPVSGFAHKIWLLPSQTAFSGNDPWLTVDAAVSNDLFYFNHFPLTLRGLKIVAPNGSIVEAENQHELKYRSVFDLPLTQRGTYRVAVVMDGAFASFMADGERRRWRGSADELATGIPENAENVQITESITRVETFVTNGGPTNEALTASGRGIELIPITHPNDLYAGETAKFQMLVNGEPASDLKVTVIQGGTRYRNTQEETELTTDAEGKLAISFSEPGMYWLSTSTSDEDTSIPQATSRRLGYTATLEVLPQ